MLAAIVSHAVIAGVLIATCRKRARDEAVLLSGSVLVVTFLTYELQGAVFATTILFPLVAAFAILANACLARCTEQKDRGSVWRWTCGAAALSVLAMLCLTNGLIVPFILAGLSLLLRLPRRTTITLLAVGAAAGLARAGLARYALGSVPVTVLSASRLAVVRFALAMLAGPVASLSPNGAVVLGAGFSTLAVWALWRFSRAPVRTSADTLLVATIWFVMGSAAMAALGRAQFDLSVAAESRYTELAAMGWASLLLFVLPPGSIRRPIGMFAVVLLPLVSLAALPLQVFVGRVWTAKADHMDVASVALAVGVEDADWVWRIYPLGVAHIDPVVEQLRARDAAFMRFPDRGHLVQGVASSTPCDGSLEAIRVSDGDGIEVHGGIRQRGNRLRIVDGGSRVRGFAKPAPVVEHARATANDFVWAELDVLTGRLETADRWLGFSTWGAGPPFTAELLDAAGQPVCHTTITCCQERVQPRSRRELVVRGGLPEGSLDAADCTTITGWAWDEARPNEPIDLRIATTEGKSVIVHASGFRRDLADQGKGDGRHGFSIPASRLKLGPGTWHVSAEIATTGVPLAGSPRTVVCQ